MNKYFFSPVSTSEEIAPVILAVHELINRLPVTAKSAENEGIRVEGGSIIDLHYTGPILEESIRTNTIIRTTPKSGPYAKVPVIVVPIRDEEGHSIGAIGLVDITGIFDLATLMEHQSAILKQVCGKDPCPLPQESIGAKK